MVISSSFLDIDKLIYPLSRKPYISRYIDKLIHPLSRKPDISIYRQAYISSI